MGIDYEFIPEYKSGEQKHKSDIIFLMLVSFLRLSVLILSLSVLVKMISLLFGRFPIAFIML